MLPPNTTPVLVIDDEDVALNVMSQLLNRIGFSEIDTALNGSDGRDLLESKAYGLIICDWNMPVMSGFDLLLAIRADDRFRRIPYILTSIDGSPERVRIARDAGVSAFLLKPFNEAKLRAKLDGFFFGSLPKKRLAARYAAAY